MYQPAVEQVEADDGVRARSTLGPLHYADAFHVGTANGDERPALAWARRMLEQAPLSTRAKLVAGWSAIGLRLRLRDPRTVLGWSVVRQTHDEVLLGADSWLGLRGQLLLTTDADGLRFCTFVAARHAPARAVWAAIEPAHVPAVRGLLVRLT